MRLSPPLPAPPRIAAAALWLPEHRDTAEAALGAGRVDEETMTRLGYHEVAESRDHAAPELAVFAARAALDEAGWSGADVGMVAHAWTYHQGHDFWSPANFVAHHIGASRFPSTSDRIRVNSPLPLGSSQILPARPPR